MKYSFLALFLFSLPMVSANAFQEFGRDVSALVNTLIGLQPDFMIRLAIFILLYGTFYILINKVPAFKPESGESDYVGARHSIAIASALLIIWILPDENIETLREVVGVSAVYLFVVFLFTALLYISYKGDPGKPYTYFFRTAISLFGFILFLHLSTADLGFINLAEHDLGFWLFLFAILMAALVFVSLISFFKSISGKLNSSSTDKDNKRRGFNFGLSKIGDKLRDFRNSRGWHNTKKNFKSGARMGWSGTKKTGSWLKNKWDNKKDIYENSKNSARKFFKAVENATDEVIKRTDKHVKKFRSDEAKVGKDIHKIDEEEHVSEMIEHEVEEAEANPNRDSEQEAALIKQIKTQANKHIEKTNKLISQLEYDLKHRVGQDFKQLREDDISLKNMAEELRKNVSKEIESLQKNDKVRSDQINSIVKEFERLENTIKSLNHKAITDEDVSKLSKLVNELNKVLSHVRKSEGEVQRILSSMSVDSDLQDLVRKLAEEEHFLKLSERDYQELDKFLEYLVDKVEKEEDFLKKLIEHEKKLNNQLGSVLK